MIYLRFNLVSHMCETVGATDRIRSRIKTKHSTRRQTVGSSAAMNEFVDTAMVMAMCCLSCFVHWRQVQASRRVQHTTAGRPKPRYTSCSQSFFSSSRVALLLLCCYYELLFTFLCYRASYNGLHTD